MTIAQRRQAPTLARKQSDERVKLLRLGESTNAASPLLHLRSVSCHPRTASTAWAANRGFDMPVALASICATSYFAWRPPRSSAEAA